MNAALGLIFKGPLFILIFNEKGLLKSPQKTQILSGTRKGLRFWGIEAVDNFLIILQMSKFIK